MELQRRNNEERNKQRKKPQRTPLPPLTPATELGEWRDALSRFDNKRKIDNVQNDHNKKDTSKRSKLYDWND